MNIILKINTDNDAFTDDKYNAELNQIWFRACRYIQRYSGESVIKNQPLYDSNGNKVGYVSKVKS